MRDPIHLPHLHPTFISASPGQHRAGQCSLLAASRRRAWSYLQLCFCRWRSRRRYRQATARPASGRCELQVSTQVPPAMPRHRISAGFGWPAATSPNQQAPQGTTHPLVLICRPRPAPLTSPGILHGNTASMEKPSGRSTGGNTNVAFLPRACTGIVPFQHRAYSP